MINAHLEMTCGCDTISTSSEMLSVKQGIEIAEGLCLSVKKIEELALSDALGRISAKDFYSLNPMPRFNNSAMDGYALKTSDFSGKKPWKFNIIGTIAAGMKPQSPHDNSHKNAWRIFTGAPIPEGFDCVVMQEKCELSNGQVIVQSLPTLNENIRTAGCELSAGSLLVAKGVKLTPRHIGLLAAHGYQKISAFKKVTVGVLSTGNELLGGDEALSAGKIYDSNRPMLLQLIKSNGVEVIDLGVIPDDFEKTKKFISKLKNKFDLIVSSGSVSVGEYDFLKPAFEKSGGKIANWKLAIKPGKPILFGQIGDTVFTGLPGNPFAVFIGYELFIKRQILKLSGQIAPKLSNKTAISSFNWKRKPGREEYFPALIKDQNENGFPVLERVGSGNSAALHPLSVADGLGMVFKDVSEVKKGDIIQWFEFSHNC